MADIIIRQSDGRVFVAAAAITETVDRFITDQGVTLWKSSIGFAPERVAGVELPADLVPGLSHNYVNGAFEESGEDDGLDEDTRAFRQRWGKKGEITPDLFPGKILQAYSTLYLPQGKTREWVADRIDRLWNDPRSTSIRETLRSPTLTRIRPMDPMGNFRAMLQQLRTVKSASDDEPLMTDAEEGAIAATFPPA
jgi:hypothetical protein